MPEPPDHSAPLRNIAALEAAEDRAYQRGQQSAKLTAQVDSHEQRLNAINGSIARHAEAVENVTDGLGDLRASVERSTAVAKARAETAEKLAKQAAKSAVDKRTFIITAVACSGTIASAVIAAIALGVGQ